jgi:transglutaminase-like putative cysteine protease
MLKVNIIVAIFCIEGLINSLSAKELKYVVADIPESLKSNANAVVRRNDVVFELCSVDKAKCTVDYVITILNKNAIDYSYLKEGYDKFLRVFNIQAIVYDANGEKVKRIPADDFIDHSYISGFSIYEDNRVKFIDPKYRTVPFTVEYHYEISYSGTFFFPDFIPSPNFGIAVEQSSFQVIVPKTSTFRYCKQNINSEVKITTDSEKTTYLWRIDSLKALKSEPLSVPQNEYYPLISTSPSDFEIDGYSGNLESWKNFGTWNLKLLENRDELPIETINKLKEICANAKDEYDKIEKIYNFLQSNTRYVSIQVGIGGWQPFPAETVDRLKYGDCKALTNYMRSMLNAFGIKAYYTLVMAREDAPRMRKDFPSNQFNHAFLCVPNENDTLWLECTSQYLPCGYNGTFTDDRDVLLITEDGGKVVHTPAYNAQHNRQVRTAIIELAADGGGAAKLKNVYHGIFYEKLLPIMLSDDVDRKKKMTEWLDIPDFELVIFNHKEVRERIPSVIETADLQLNNYASVMGTRLLVPLNLMTKEDLLPRKKEERRSDILIRRAYTDIDTITYKIPQFYKVEGIPANDGIKSDFGEYWYKTEQTDKEIKYIRYLRMDKGQYDKSRYNDLYAFFEKISVMDNIKAVLVTGTN